MNINNNYCRICLNIDTKNEFLDIFSPAQIVQDRAITINILVKECASINVEPDDGYPRFICTLCFKNLSIAYKFKELCLQTNKKLRDSKYLLNQFKTCNYQKISINSSISSHFENIDNSDEILNSKNSEVNTQKLDDFKCSYCKKVFKNETQKDRHQSIHTRRIVCEICGKVSGHEANFEIHMRTHTGDKPFTCRICGVSKTTEGDLKSHMKIHSDECKYSCYICGKQFKWLSNQLRHMRWHKGEKTHKCNVCGKFFFESSGVKKHMLTHTGEKPFSCRICERAFIRKNLLRTHYNVIHNSNMPFYS